MELGKPWSRACRTPSCRRCVWTPSAATYGADNEEAWGSTRDPTTIAERVLPGDELPESRYSVVFYMDGRLALSNACMCLLLFIYALLRWVGLDHRSQAAMDYLVEDHPVAQIRPLLATHGRGGGGTPVGLCGGADERARRSGGATCSRPGGRGEPSTPSCPTWP